MLMNKSSGTQSCGNFWFLASFHSSKVFRAHLVHLVVFAGIKPLPSSARSWSPMNSENRVGGSRLLHGAGYGSSRWVETEGRAEFSMLNEPPARLPGSRCSRAFPGKKESKSTPFSLILCRFVYCDCN